MYAHAFGECERVRRERKRTRKRERGSSVFIKFNTSLVLSNGCWRKAVQLYRAKLSKSTFQNKLYGIYSGENMLKPSVEAMNKST